MILCLCDHRESKGHTDGGESANGVDIVNLILFESTHGEYAALARKYKRIENHDQSKHHVAGTIEKQRYKIFATITR